ncbi:MAG: V-type ATPase 116kDa subunit family protein [Candidatus Hydrogenedentota bacterium]
MVRLEIVFMRYRLAEMVAFLQEQGLVHLEEVPLAVENTPGFLHRVHLEDDQKAELESLESLHKMLNEIAPLLRRRVDETEVHNAMRVLSQADPTQWTRQARKWSRELRSLTRRRVNIEDNIAVFRHFRDTLRLIGDMLGGQDVALGKNGRAFVLKGDTNLMRRRLRHRFQRELGLQSQFTDKMMDRNVVLGLVVYPEKRNDVVSRILHDEGIEMIEVPDKRLQGKSVQEVLRRTDESIAEQTAELKEIQKKLDTFSRETGPELTALRLLVTNRMKQLRVVSNFAQSEFVGVIHGWVPADEAGALEEALAERFPGEVITDRLPIERVERRRVPVLLKNHRLLQPFEVLMGLMKPPSYGTLDPSALVGIFFVLFYGYIVGDVVYGALILLLALVLRQWFGRNETIRKVTSVYVYAALSTIMFGVLFGEYCGDFGPRMFSWLKPLWFARHHDTLRLLIAAVAFGVVHVVLSLVLAMYSHWYVGDRKHALEKLGLLLGLFAVAVAVTGLSGTLPIGMGTTLGLGGVLLGIALFLLVNAGGALAPVHVLEIVSLIGNVISYSRLMALGIASVAIANVANTLSRDAKVLWLAIFLFLIVHLFNIALSLFSPTLHSLRLNYVEFLPKFYTPEGRRYQPFRKETLW